MKTGWKSVAIALIAFFLTTFIWISYDGYSRKDVVRSTPTVFSSTDAGDCGCHQP